jgi:hypothetical protein
MNLNYCVLGILSVEQMPQIELFLIIMKDVGYFGLQNYIKENLLIQNGGITIPNAPWVPNG